MIYDLDFLEPIFKNSPKPSHRITENIDFFALIEGSRPIIHWNFDRNMALAGELDHQLAIEIESIALEFQVTQAVGTKHLVHRKWILEPQAVDGINQRRKKPVTQIHEVAEDRLAGE